MLILLLDAYNGWKWDVSPTFQRNILPPSSAADVFNTAHFHAVQAPKTRINIRKVFGNHNEKRILCILPNLFSTDYITVSRAKFTDTTLYNRKYQILWHVKIFLTTSRKHKSYTKSFQSQV
jgi:hypothetical protein